MEQLKQILNQYNNGKRKQTTLDQIENNIRRLYLRCYDALPEDISQIAGMIGDINHTFACLQSDWDGKKLSYSTKLAYVNAIVLVNDVLGLQFSETYLDFERELQVRRADYQRKNPVKTTKLNALDLDKIYSGLIEKKNLKDIILFNIISHYPFRCETATLKLISKNSYDSLHEKPKINYLIQDDDIHTFAFNAYKTDKRYGTREIQIDDDELNSLFSEYLTEYNEGDFIFWAADDDSEKSQNKQRNNLTVWTRRLLRKNDLDASITDITKYLITHIWDTGSVQDKIKFAEWRGHDVLTASKVYATTL